MATLLLCSLLAGVPAAFAQQGTAEIRGQVKDAQDAVLPGVTVTVRNQETGMFRQGTTTADGTYFLSGVMPGVYELTAELAGFKKYARPNVRLEVGRTASVDLQLEVGGLEEQMTVTAEAPLVDVTSKEVGGHISARELTDLPTVNRNFIGFIGLLPGVIANISTESFGSDAVTVNGQDSRNNNYLIDGANNNDDVIGQRAGTQARTPLEAIQEFQVLTSQFDAEFGRTTGAVINAITKQGTNAFHGSAFAYLQDASLTAKDHFVKQNNTRKPDTRFQQYGFTLGGPVVRNKAHFFAAVERVLIDDARTINIPARTDLNASPTTETRVWNSIVRFDHQINAGNTWNVRWLREYSPQFNQIIPSAAGPPGSAQVPVSLAAAREEDDLDQTVVASLNSSLGNTRFNTFRVSFTQEDVAFATPGFNSNGRRQDQLPPTLRYLTYIDQQSDVAQARVNNAYQVEDTFSWFVPGRGGDHNVRAGLQYQYITADFDTQDVFNGVFSFRTNTPFNAADPRTYPERLTIRVPGPNAFLMKAHYVGAFVQDKWRLNDRLTLSLGLRYDLEKIPVQERDNPRFASPDDYPVDGNNLAPRIGFSFDPRADGRTVVRGGYGRFFDKTHFELISAIITSGVFSESFIANFPANAADPGPSRGVRPTEPLLANGPEVNRALLGQLFPAGTRQRNTGTVFLDDPGRRVPYTDQVSLGFERALGRDMSVSLDYVHAFARDQFMSRELNPGVRVNTTRTGAVNRVDRSFVASVQQRINAGRTDYDALQASLEKRWSGHYRFRVGYTLAYSRGNTAGVGIPASNLQFLDDLRLEANEGPTDIDRRHNFVFSGSAMVPGTGLTFGTVVRALSGAPFTLQDTSTDADQNGLFFEPLPAGTYSGTGRNAFTVENDGGRNGARGPWFFQADARLGYQFRFGERRLDVFGEVFNLTNRANFELVTANSVAANGDRRLPTFLTYTALRAGAVPRTAQLGVRVGF
jgi:outer membrane receptor protein involved in Fe transport